MNEQGQGVDQSVETVEESFGTKPGDVVSRWNEELRIAGKNEHTWLGRASKTVQRFRDERPSTEKNDTKYNILWSNTETIKPALFSRKPKPMVDRRNKDRGKPPEVEPNMPPEQQQKLAMEWQEHEKLRKASLEAAMVLERAIEYSLDEYDFEGLMMQLVEDYQLPGRGVAKAEYVPIMRQERFEAEPDDYEYPDPEIDEFGDIIEQEPKPIYAEGVEHDDDGPYTMEDVVEYEYTECRYVFWKDFRMGKAKVWAEVPWVAFRTEMDRKALHERFDDSLGADAVDKIPLNRVSKDADSKTLDDDVLDLFKRAEVWEIWDRIGGEVIWIVKDYADKPLDQSEPPINFAKFFPCNEPLTMVQNNGSMEPIPEYYMYQDQARELNTMTARINLLAKALKLAGVYDKNNVGLQKVLNTSNENKLIPVESWSAFADKGGIKGAISWLPITEVQVVMQGLYQHREAVKQDMYELTGIADIIRGASNANETAAAQQIKGRFAGMRLQDKQNKVARAARDLIRLKAEIICEQFDKETIQLMSGMMMSDEAYELLQNDPMRRFRISIETDSTIQPNENEEKKSRSEFLTASGRFMEQAIKFVQIEPEFTDVMGEMLMFGIRGFRAGRELEDSMQTAIDRISEKNKKKQEQPQQDPRAAAIAADQKRKQQDAQLKLVEKKQDLTFDQQKHQQEMRQDEEKFQQEMRQDGMKESCDMEKKEEMHEQDMMHKNMKNMNDMM